MFNVPPILRTFAWRRTILDLFCSTPITLLIYLQKVNMKTTFITASYLLYWLANANAFCLDSPTRPVTSTALFAERRTVLGNIRAGIVSVATFAAFRQRVEPAYADEIVQTDGRVIELQIANLDGVEGSTGVVKIELKKDWAPRGVKRFEVRPFFSGHPCT